MTNDITRRDALALGVSAAALAATGAQAQAPASNIKAADVPEPKLAIEKGASALNETVQAGNRLTTWIGYLTAVGVGLALVSVLGTGVQIAIAWGCIGPRARGGTAIPSAGSGVSSQGNQRREPFAPAREVPELVMPRPQP